MMGSASGLTTNQWIVSAQLVKQEANRVKRNAWTITRNDVHAVQHQLRMS